MLLLTLLTLLVLSHGHGWRSSSTSSSSSSSTSTSSSDKDHGSFRRPKKRMKEMRYAFVTHGINIFNGEVIADYTSMMRFPPMVNGVWEIGAYDPNNSEPEDIISTTDTSKLVATTRWFHRTLGGPPLNIDVIDDKFVNVPLGEVGTFRIGSTSVDDRAKLVKFDMIDERGEVHGSSYMQHDITIDDWNKASGLLTVKKFPKDELYTIKFEMCGFTNSVYTIWESGVKNSLAVGSSPTDPAGERVFSAAAGGVPNIIVTDKYGYGSRVWQQKWNPLECIIGQDCTASFSAFYHWDGMAYGGAPEMFFQGMGAGIIAANHLWVPTAGTNNIDPQNTFKGPYCQ